MKNKIISYLSTECPWRDTLYWYPTIDSTNTQIKKLAQEGAPHGTVVIAAHQTHGRGRMGRSFHSPKDGGIYLSVLLRPNCPPTDLMHLTCAVGVSMCDAVENATKFRPQIKWINDLLARGKKLGGLLTELSIAPKTGLVDYAIVGIGINCSQDQKEFPEELQDIAISLKTATGIAPVLDILAAEMVRALWRMDQKLLSEKSDIMDQYRNDCVTIGQDIVLIRGEEKKNATALGIADDGQLLVRYPNGTEDSVGSGEVSCRATK